MKGYYTIAQAKQLLQERKAMLRKVYTIRGNSRSGLQTHTFYYLFEPAGLP